MIKVQLRTSEAEVLKAFPDEGSAPFAHLAMVTKRTPGEIGAKIDQLTQKGMTVLQEGGQVRLTSLGANALQALLSGEKAHCASRADARGRPTGATTGSWTSSLIGAAAGFAILGPFGLVAAVSGAALGGTIGTIAGGRLEANEEPVRVEILPDA